MEKSLWAESRGHCGRLTQEGFPEYRKAIHELSVNEDFVELCEHFTLMAEATETNPDPHKRTRYAELRDQLEAELQNYLNPNDKHQEQETP